MSRVSGWVDRYLELCARRPGRVLLVAALVFAAAAWCSSRLGFRSSFLELLPDDSPEVRDLEFVGEKAGGDGYLVVAIDASDLARARAFAQALGPTLEALTYVDAEGAGRKLVRYTESRAEVRWFEDRALYFVPVERLREAREAVERRVAWEKASATGLYVDVDEPPDDFARIEQRLRDTMAPGLSSLREWMVGSDGKYLYVLAKPNGVAGDLRYCHALVSQVEVAAAKLAAGFPGLAPVRLSGMYVVRIDDDRTLRADIQASSGLAVALAVLIILVATRFRPVALVLVLLPMLLGVVVTFAIAWFAVTYVSIVTGFLVAVLVGLGIEYGIHLSMRYWEERERLDVAPALRAAVHGTLGGAVTSAATNGLAFLVLVTARFEAFRQFGFIASVGVASTLVAAYLLCPAVLVFAERVRPFRRAGAPVAVEARRTSPVVPTWALVGALVAFLVAALWSLGAVPKFDTDLRNLSRSDAMEFDAYVARSLGVDIVPAVAWAKDVEDAAVVQASVRAVAERAGAGSVIDSAASLSDLVPGQQPEKAAELALLQGVLARLPKAVEEKLEPERLARLRRMVAAQPFGVDALPEVVSRRFRALDGVGNFVLVFPKPLLLFDSQHLETWGNQLTAVAVEARTRGVTTHVLHESRIAARIFQLVRADGPPVLLGAALVIFLVLLLDLRSVGRAALVMGPLAIGFTWLLGAMSAFGVSLNVLSAVIVPNLVAIAVDNAVHIYHRYREEGPGSLAHVLRHTGLAALVATLANGSGYGALIIAHHRGLHSVAQVALLGIVCTSVGTTIFFPVLLELLERWRGRAASSVRGPA